MSQQSVVQDQLAQRRIKQIRDRMTIQIDHKYAPPRNATHLTQNLHHLLINKMMREQRTDHVIKLRIRKRQLQRIPTHTTDLIKPLRLLINRLRRTLIQLEPYSPKLALSLSSPGGRDAQQLSRPCANVEDRKAPRAPRFNLAKQRGP